MVTEMAQLEHRFKVSLDIQTKIISWFLFKEGAILPEIILRLTTVYGAGSVDIVAVTVFLQEFTIVGHTTDQDAKVKKAEKVEDGEKDIGGDNTARGHDSVEEQEVDTDEPAQSDTQPPVFKSRQKVTCSHCNKVTVNKYTLDTHITACHPEACLSCRECGKAYGLAELLSKHVRLKHDKTPRVEIHCPSGEALSAKLGWKCPDCEKVFRSKKAQELHSFRHAAKGEKMFECGICAKKLRNPVTLEKHIETLHKGSGEQLECSQCHVQFTVRSKWREHMRSHELVCRVCFTVFSTETELKTHTVSCERLTGSSRAVRCEYCGNSYSSDGVLKHHIKRVHLKEFDFNCDRCDLKFSSKADMHKHAVAKHDTERLGFVCDFCGKSYASSANLKNHIAYEHQNKEKPFACDICQSRFVYRPEMLRHRERHTAVPKHYCPSCDKKFVTRGDMLRHKKVVHENYYAGSCEICGRKFQSFKGKEFSQHMKSHAGVKDVSCPICNKLFATDDNLKCHMVSHYDIKYWSCRLCSKTFKWIKNVKYHLKAVHALAQPHEIKKNCVKLRKGPTKSEIESVAVNNSKVQDQQLQQEEATILELDTVDGRQPDYVDLHDFKATFLIPE